jgi:hypothetical protein
MMYSFPHRHHGKRPGIDGDDGSGEQNRLWMLPAPVTRSLRERRTAGEQGSLKSPVSRIRADSDGLDWFNIFS